MTNQQDEYEYVQMPPQQMQGVPIPQRVDRADFVDKIKPEHIVEVIRHKLLGEEYIDNKWVEIKALKKYSLTQYGAWDLSNVMLACSSINVSISKYKSDQINQRMRNLIKEVMIKVLTSWREYGITNVGQIYYIKSLFMSNGMAVLSQAGEGSIQELFKTSVSEQRMISTEKKEPGRIKRLLGMGS